MARKLHYFDINGIAESIRYLLHYGGHKFEDVRYEESSWKQNAFREKVPFAQLPYYEEGTRTLNQSLAIARYIGYQTKLVPTDPWDQAVLDAVVFTIYDFWAKFLTYFKETDSAKQAFLKKEFLAETVPFFFTRFEKTLKDNKGYFFGGKLTWADFVFIGIVECVDLFLGVQVEKEYPTVVALFQKIRSLPGVKEYIQTRKPYSADYSY